MQSSLLCKCQQKKTFKENNEVNHRWVDVEASSLEGVDGKKIRCMHCKGAVKLCKRKIENGPMDHVRHKSRQDSEGCKAGEHFQGVHRESTEPVN